MFRRIIGTASALLGLAVVYPWAATAQTPSLRVEQRSLIPVAGQDEITFEVPAGHLLEVRALSDEFDTILELHSPIGGEPLRNDDDGTSTNSRLSTFASDGGRWRAVVSGYAEGSGAYEFRVSITSPGDVETIAGRLDADAIASPKGGRYRIHEFTVESPSDVVLEIDAATAIEDVIAIAPDGQRYTRGQWGYGASVPLTINAATPGRWQLIVFGGETDYGTGDYRLYLMQTPQNRQAQSFNGTLAPGDELLVRGELFDRYHVEIGDESIVDIVLTSTEFDTFLAVRPPSGEWVHNDDGMQGGSRIELPGERGRWEILVTSYGPGESGDYRLSISPR